MMTDTMILPTTQISSPSEKMCHSNTIDTLRAEQERILSQIERCKATGREDKIFALQLDYAMCEIKINSML